MTRTVGRMLISQDAIAHRVRQLGTLMARRYTRRKPVLVAIMKGSIPFLADLIRAWPGPLNIEFVTAESYDGVRAGKVRLGLPTGLRAAVRNRPVLVIDDICDTGATLRAVVDALKTMGPTEVRTLVLLQKRRRSGPRCDSTPQRPLRSICRPNWVGFHIDDHFVVGYGLDYRGLYRNLPYIAALRPKR